MHVELCYMLIWKRTVFVSRQPQCFKKWPGGGGGCFNNQNGYDRPIGSSNSRLRVLNLLVIIVFSVVVLHILMHSVPTEVTRDIRIGHFRRGGGRSNQGRLKAPTT